MSGAHTAKSASTNADPASDAFATILSLLDDGTTQDATAVTDGNTKLAANDGSKSIDALLKPSDTTDPTTATAPAPTDKGGKTFAQPSVHWRAAELDADKATNDNDGRVHADHPRLKGDVTDADAAKDTSAKVQPVSDVLSRFGAPVDPSALKPSEDVKPGKKSDSNTTTATQHTTLRTSDGDADSATNAALLLQPAQTPTIKPTAISLSSDATIRSGEDIAPASANPTAKLPPVAPQAAADDAQDDAVIPAPQPAALKPTSTKPSDKTASTTATNSAPQDLSESQTTNDPKAPPAPVTMSGDTKTPTSAPHFQPHATTATEPDTSPATPAQTAQAQAVQQNQPAAQSQPQPSHADANAASAVAAPAAPAPVAAPQAQLQLHAQLQAGNAEAAPNLSALAVQIATHSDDGQKHFNIRLDPPELGRVDVHMTVDDTGKAQATLSVDKPQTLALLQKDAPELQRQLKDAGLDLSQNGLNFSLRQQQQNAGNPDGNANGSRGRNQTIRAVAAVDAPSSASNTVSVGAADARLDIRV
jgi:flagellar hook-length control protein FliK